MRYFYGFFLIFSLIFVDSAEIKAEENQSRVVFHGRREVFAGWSISAWSIFPNISQGTTNLIVAGPSYYQKNWYLEGMIGKVVKEGGNGSFLFNIRGFCQFSKFHTWAEIEYFPKDEALYWFAQLDYPVNIKGKFLGKIGIETENTHFLKNGKDGLGLEPHLILPVANNLAIITAYQWQGNKEDFFRFYTIVEF